jgi:succinate dehydrogenase / fumarate reductase flavoprotein subunit
MPQPRVIIVGGGLAGLSAAIRIAEAGTPVDLFSMVPVKRSHSVCAQGGINACNEVARQQGYSEWMHVDETLYGGDFLNHQAPVYEMCHWAPRIIDLLDRMGVPFNRTKEGQRDLRLFGGSLFKRTHFAGASTGQQLLYALDEQTRRYETEGKVTKYEFWEFLWPIIDDHGECKGIVAQDMRSMEIKAFRADAVVMATGGCGLIFGKSTMSVICTGGAASRCYQAGAWLGNPEMIQVHPTAIPGEDKCRLMSESARGEGGRVWVPRKKGDTRKPLDIPEAERWYFLEEKYPKYGNLVPRDIATREIFFVCRDGYGVGGGRQVYLDVSHLPAETKKKLHAILEIYEKFTGDSPVEVPMKIFPAVHYSMGGLYTVFTEEERPAKPGDKCTTAVGMKLGAPNNMMTNIAGLYAFGEVNYNYHGANRLGANALLNCIFDGLFCGLSVVNYVKDVVKRHAEDMPADLFSRFVEQENGKMKRLVDGTGGNANPYDIHRRLGDEMTESCTVVREGPRLAQALSTVAALREEYKGVKLSDTGMWTNQNLSFTRALGDMLIYAEAILLAADARKESRGAHYRPDFPQRDDEQFLKTTIAKFNPIDGSHRIEYEAIPLPLATPRKRDYGKTEAKNEQRKEPVTVAN